MENRLLIVDDDDAFRASLQRQFHGLRKHLSLEILEAKDGQAAVSVLTNNPVDCVLLDYMMPGGSGLDWLKSITESAPGVAVIMVTGSGDETVAVEAMKTGAADYLVKGSISPDSLRRAVMNALRKREMAETIRKQRDELLDAERQRVMIESLGAACHHLGQPATVIMAYLELIKRTETTRETGEMIDKALEAAQAMAEIFQRLRDVSCYRKVPYLAIGKNEAWRPDASIVQI